ncbi:dynamin GTPase [Glonium stellatum]|uniref:Dynamin GTPase n=1 Tax=Glonium stellatum TaxID=574774 RepID=A0A8E2ETW1_9PEZI|nr:dynamin GTPase [Glonium stellatum]
MAAPQLGQITVERLQSHSSLTLLDDIDKLRSQGISHYVHLPQLIVCGDQSSGKSSVLEALSGIPFPAKDNLCTRFATEVILRRNADASASVAIVPGSSRTEEEAAKLLSFRRTLHALDAFPALVDETKDLMGVGDSSKAFSADVLRIEISGPTQPQLTIVDLPGLIHSENKLQSAADIQIVQDMVYGYMANRRSIILAVVSAKNDYANQIVLKLARQVDPRGQRTMGIITKPDTLSSGSESEMAFVNLAQNMDVEFRLGWHVLKNRSYETREFSLEARDDSEKQFFDQGIWKALPRELLGISTLRERLSRILVDQITSELPALLQDIEENISACQATLAKLGPARASLDSQRLFLLQISQEFQAISKAALDGIYEHAFFGEPRSPDGYSKRLRAVVQNLNLEFAAIMRLQGQHRRISSELSSTANSAGGRETISRKDFITEIQELLDITRGRELPGMFNPLIVGDLFYEQSQPWRKLASQHIKTVWDATRGFIILLLSHLSEESTAGAFLMTHIESLLTERLRMANLKLDEILKPYERGHPITYNHYFTETIQRVKQKRYEEEIARNLRKFYGLTEGTFHTTSVKSVQLPNLLTALTQRSEPNMDRYACSEILDCMEAYYKVALKLTVDNVAIQAVENCLLSGINDVISPSSIMQMDKELVYRIAGESQQNQGLRLKMQRKLKILQAGLEVCGVYMKGKCEIAPHCMQVTLN